MAINRVEIKDFLVFKGEFAADFCPGINVFIGGNGTGKTTLLKSLYRTVKFILYHRSLPNSPGKIIIDDGQTSFRYDNSVIFINITNDLRVTYIPEKDILEHAKGLLTFIVQKQTGFGPEYRDVLIAAQDVQTQEQSEVQKVIGQKIISIIGGDVHWDKGEGSFYTLKTDGSRIPFANEASGFKKMGFLGLLVSSGQLEPGSVLFWDEPENSLNPELVPILVDVLLELSRNNVQMFLGTHDYNLARYFDVRKDKSIPLLFHNLSKTATGQIICNSSPEYIKLPDNLLEAASADLFEAVVADAMGGAGR